jgi:hypothetical protein
VCIIEISCICAHGEKGSSLASVVSVATKRRVPCEDQYPGESQQSIAKNFSLYGINLSISHVVLEIFSVRKEMGERDM